MKHISGIPVDIKYTYTEWCKDTNRHPGSFYGGNIEKFFDWADSMGFKLIVEDPEKTSEIQCCPNCNQTDSFKVICKCGFQGEYLQTKKRESLDELSKSFTPSDIKF